jgi:hypothetical protein
VDLGQTAFDASQGCEHRDCCVDRLWWRRPYLGFNSIPMRLSQTLWAMEVEVLQRFYTTCGIPFEIGSQGIGSDGTQVCDLVMWSTLTLEPQGFHPLLHAWMWMMVALIVQRLCVCLTACKSEHPLGHPFDATDRCGAPS